MEKAMRKDGWKILVVVLVCLTGLFIFLVALASSQMAEPGPDALPVPNRSQGPSHSLLKDFEFVPGSALLIDDHHVLALYKNSEKEFYAVILFNADCDRSGCTPTELIAFSIVDRDGKDVEFANNAGKKSRGITPDI